jgi:hypothetical protein
MSQAGAYITTSGPGAVVETLTGNSGGAVGPNGGNINVVGTGSITVTGNPGTSTLTISSSGGGGGITTLDGDAGFATGSTVSITAGNSTQACGSSVLFTGDDVSALTLGVTDAANNTIIGLQAGNESITGSTNVGLGLGVLQSLTSGSGNTALGSNSLVSILTGAQNVCIGNGSGTNYVGAESNNICIGNSETGTIGDNGVITIGNQSGNTTACYIGGIYGTSLSGSSVVVTSGGRLGVGSGGGGGVTTIDGDTGFASGATVNINSGNSSQLCGSSVSFIGDDSATVTLNVTDLYDNIIIGKDSGNASITGNGNVAVGYNTFIQLGTGAFNQAFGYEASRTITTGSYNIAIGQGAKESDREGSYDVAIGSSSLGNIETSTNNYNTAVGHDSLAGLSTGIYNVALGQAAGSSYNAGESSNIMINSAGIAGESNTLRIGGATGTSDQQLSSAYIAGIQGNSLSGKPVVVTSGDQLGVASGFTGNSILYSSLGILMGAPGVLTYAIPGYSGSSYTSSQYFYFPYAGTISNLYFNCSSNSSTTNNTITLYKNGSSTSLVVTTTALTTGLYSDTTHSVAVAAGDHMQWVGSASTTGYIDGQITMNFNG